MKAERLPDAPHDREPSFSLGAPRMRHRTRRIGLIVLALVLLALPAGAGDSGGLLSGTLGRTTQLVGGVVNTLLEAPAKLLSTVGKVTVALLRGTPPNGDTRRAVMVPIDGSTGGVARVGRFTVTVPAGAWSGMGTVSIQVPNPDVVQCELDVTGVPNAFARLVTLEVDTRQTGASDPGVVWFDPGTGKWYLLAASGSRESQTVTLRHFSKYGCVGGKAGW